MRDERGNLCSIAVTYTKNVDGQGQKYNEEIISVH
jgi:hypothetical protein